MRFLIIFLFFSARCFALVTAYVSFDHPEAWKCELIQGVWVCQSQLEPDRKESIIFSIATVAGEWDTIENYEDYLKQGRAIQDEEGNTVNAKVTFARKRNINGLVWVDSLQLNSEVPGFWTRYLCTVHNKLAILITYLVSEDRYSQLAPQFDRMVASLKPNAEFDLNIASKQGDSPLPGPGKLGPVQKDILTERLNLKKRKEDKKEEVPPPSSSLPTLMLLGLVAGGAGYWFWRKRRKKSSVAAAAPETPPKSTDISQR